MLLPVPKTFSAVLALLIIVGMGSTSDASLRIQPIRMPLMDGKGIRFRPLSTEQGLSQNRVSHNLQDDRGFIWLGRGDGLKRFDGYRFRDYGHDPGDPNSRSGSFVWALFKDRSGMRWGGPLYHISQNREGMIWLATLHGLTRLDQADGTFWVAATEGLDIFGHGTGKVTRHFSLRNELEGFE